MCMYLRMYVGMSRIVEGLDGGKSREYQSGAESTNIRMNECMDVLFIIFRVSCIIFVWDHFISTPLSFSLSLSLSLSISVCPPIQISAFSKPENRPTPIDIVVVHQ
jgi:hypothetical protein